MNSFNFQEIKKAHKHAEAEEKFGSAYCLKPNRGLPIKENNNIILFIDRRPLL